MQGARLALPLLLLALMSSGPARAQTIANQAGLVVVHGDGRVTTRCVAFPESQISGADLLSRSGLSLSSTAGPLGLTICSLNGEGCPSTDCFCECHSTPCVYWVYYHGDSDGSWTYANIGAVSRQITNGDVDAWMWGEASKLPPSVTFDAICGQTAPAVEIPPAQETPVPTVTPKPVSPIPTETPIVELTVTLTLSPTPKATATAAAQQTSTLAPIAAATLTPTPSLTSPTEAPLDDAPLVTDVSTSTVEAPQLDVPPLSDNLGQDLPGQLLAFVAVLGIVGGAFALLSRRSGTK